MTTLAPSEASNKSVGLSDLERVERELRDDASPHLGDGWSLHRKRQADTIAAYIARAKEQGYADIESERDALRKDFDAALAECKLLTHKVITCGVAASHPDASLAHTGAYKEKWDSPQAEEVRKLRAERDALKNDRDALDRILSQLERVTDSTKAERDALKAEVALRKSEVELFRDKLKARCDEVAKLSAAAAQMREALEAFDADQVPHDMALEMREAALSTDAGKGWVDASGAVKAKVLRQTAFGNAWLEWTPMPADWAGAPVKIVRVKP